MTCAIRLPVEEVDYAAHAALPHLQCLSLCSHSLQNRRPLTFATERPKTARGIVST